MGPTVCTAEALHVVPAHLWSELLRSLPRTLTRGGGSVGGGGGPSPVVKRFLSANLQGAAWACFYYQSWSSPNGLSVFIEQFIHFTKQFLFLPFSSSPFKRNLFLEAVEISACFSLQIRAATKLKSVCFGGEMKGPGLGW